MAKRKPSVTIRAAWITGGFTLGAAIVAGLFLWVGPRGSPVVITVPEPVVVNTETQPSTNELQETFDTLVEELRLLRITSDEAN